MLFTLGVGSAASLTGCVISVVCDALPNYKRWIITVVICSIGFLLGLVYVTPVRIGYLWSLTNTKPILLLNRVDNLFWMSSISSEEVCY